MQLKKTLFSLYSNPSLLGSLEDPASVEIEVTGLCRTVKVLPVYREAAGRHVVGFTACSPEESETRLSYETAKRLDWYLIRDNVDERFIKMLLRLLRGFGVHLTAFRCFLRSEGLKVKNWYVLRIPRNVKGVPGGTASYRDSLVDAMENIGHLGLSGILRVMDFCCQVETVPFMFGSDSLLTFLESGIAVSKNGVYTKEGYLELENKSLGKLKDLSDQSGGNLYNEISSIQHMLANRTFSYRVYSRYGLSKKETRHRNK